MFQLNLLLPFLLSFLITLLATPLTIKLATKYKLVDNPKLRPHPAHIQERTVPRAGGLPIYLGILFAILIFIPIDKHILGILLGTLVLLIMGLLDDKLKNFSPYKRLFLQLFAVSIVVSAGIGISFIANPLGGFFRLDQVVIPFNLLGPHRIIPIADLLAFFWIVWVMNIVNFSKGVDGQMPGIILVAALTIGVLSLKLFSHGDPNQFTIAQLSFITAGAAAAFLIFNWYPSKIYPGFSGSNILGFMIAVLSILSGAKVATALLVLLIPTVDFIYLVFRRILSGRSPVLGDRNHLHHKLLDLGWSHRQISLFYITSCAILGTLAAILPNNEKTFTVVGAGAVILGIILWLQFYLREQHSSGH
jgi:UDP-GlcNAc:undecaprenyl-phosphate GlcNAc-1-phosphate transferase